MRAEDLMIGDWVQYQYTGGVFQIVEISKTEGIKQFEDQPFFKLNGIIPIPLTAEILEKNGFNDSSFEANKKYKYIIHTNEYQLGYYPKTNSFNIYKRGIDPFYTKDVLCCGFQNIVKYVHELQHALKLCGIDKEIVV